MAETLRSGTVPGVSSPVLRSSASGVAGIFGGARKVEVRANKACGSGRRGVARGRGGCPQDVGFGVSLRTSLFFLARIVSCSLCTAEAIELVETVCFTGCGGRRTRWNL